MTRPAVLITRRIPSSVVERLDAECTVDLYDGPGAMPGAELKARLAGKQGLLCVLTDRIDGDVLDAAPGLRVVANIAVAIYAFYALSRHYRLRVTFDFVIIKQLFLLGILFSASFFIIMLNFRVDVILLQRMTDLSEVGLYSLAVQISEQLWQIPLAISIIIFSQRTTDFFSNT